MIHSINYFFTKIFDIILYPFTFINEFWGILFLSILSSIVVLFIYKYISSPSGIRAAKDQIKANILAIRIYKDFWKVIVTSFGKSLVYTVKYFALNLVPLLLVIPILAPVFSQMYARYEMKPYSIGDSLVVKVKFYKDVDLNAVEVKLDSNGLLAAKTIPNWGIDKNHQPRIREMKPVVVEALNEINWKLKVAKADKGQIRIDVNGKGYEKSLVTDPGYRGNISEFKFGQSTLDHMLYPVEDIFKDSETVRYVHIYHRGRLISFLGLDVHWLIYYLLFVVVFVLGFKKRFGVEF